MMNRSLRPGSREHEVLVEREGMSVIRFIGGVLAIVIAFWLAVKVVAFLFALIGVILSVVKLAIFVGLIALLGYGVYRFFVPAERRME